MRCARALALCLAVALLALLAGNAGAQATKPKVKLLFPTEGMIIPAGDVTVTMSVTGAILKPADTTHDPRTGHFHLYMDKVPEPGTPIPQGVDGIWHTPETAFAITKVSSGVHTLILVWAYGDHVPYSPWVSDTIMFEAK